MNHSSSHPQHPLCVPFIKGHGTRNDFVLLEDHDGHLDLRSDQVTRLCERTQGLGADGVIRVVRSDAARIGAGEDAPTWFMDYRNADGSLSEMCGNGVRVLAAHLVADGLETGPAFDVLTRAGTKHVEILEDGTATGTWQVRVGMGPARDLGVRRDVCLDGQILPARDVDLGNPHAVAFVPDDLALADLDLSARPRLDPEPPEGANIELVQIRGARHAAMRVVERGVGETLSCGTGACAVALATAAHLGEEPGATWRIDVPGGTLTVGATGQGESTLAGPADLVARGTVRI